MTVAVPESSVTTAAPLLVAVSATQVAAAVMSHSEPSITRYSSSSATLVIVITILSQVWSTAESPSATEGEENKSTLEPSSVNVPPTAVAEAEGASLT